MSPNTVAALKNWLGENEDDFYVDYSGHDTNGGYTSIHYDFDALLKLIDEFAATFPQPDAAAPTKQAERSE